MYMYIGTGFPRGKRNFSIEKKEKGKERNGRGRKVRDRERRGRKSCFTHFLGAIIQSQPNFSKSTVSL